MDNVRHSMFDVGYSTEAWVTMRWDSGLGRGPW